MNIGVTDGLDPSAVHDDATGGMLVAPEAEHLVQALVPMSVPDVASDKWLTQHGWIERLNMQAHVNASQMRDEFVMEALVLHEKMGVLVHSLLASELWRTHVYPRLRDEAAERDGVRLYQALYHEAVLANLLEVRRARRGAAGARPPEVQHVRSAARAPASVLALVRAASGARRPPQWARPQPAHTRRTPDSAGGAVYVACAHPPSR